MWRGDLQLYPRRATVAEIARRQLQGHDLTIAAECFADDYRDDMRMLNGEYDRPPCVECEDKTIYLCYLTGCECRVFALWDDMER